MYEVTKIVYRNDCNTIQNITTPRNDTMTTRSAYPPNHFHSSRSIAPHDAGQALAAYLANTPAQAYLHPDAILSQSGIRFPAQSGPQGGLALHHLRRIEAGIRGENLVAESNEELKAMFAIETPVEEAHAGKKGRSAMKVEQWQDQDMEDPEEYAQEQSEVLEEIGNDTLMGTGEQIDHIPEVKSTDKKARKEAKKAKRKEEKRQKEQAKVAG